MPTFLKSRKYIDFSVPDTAEQSYERLLRNLHSAPELTKPKLGKKPGHLTGPAAVLSRAGTIAKRIRSIAESGRGNMSLAKGDYLDAFQDTLEELRITYSREVEDSWCEKIAENIRQSLPLRDSFVEVCKVVIASEGDDRAGDSISELLDVLLRFKRPRNASGGFFEISQDNYRFLCYEFFLYAIASCIKARRYGLAARLMSSSYLEPRDFNGEHSISSYASAFNEYAKSINETCAVDGNTRRTSKTGDWIMERATIRTLNFRSLCEADAILAINPKVCGWWPRSMVLSFREGPFDLFVKAETPDGFRPLGELLGMSKPQELVQLLLSEVVQRKFASGAFFRFGRGLTQLNMKALQEIYGSK